MATTVTYNLNGLKALQKQLNPWSNKLSLAIATATPKKIVNSIKKRTTGIFTLDVLPENADSTIARKGHNKTLVGKKKLLTQASKWQIGKEGNKFAVVPPKGREDVVGYLQEGVTSNQYGKQQYKILDLPENFLPKWVKTMIVKAFNTFMKQYA